MFVTAERVKRKTEPDAYLPRNNCWPAPQECVVVEDAPPRAVPTPRSRPSPVVIAPVDTPRSSDADGADSLDAIIGR